jgi:hypothetical protein
MLRLEKHCERYQGAEEMKLKILDQVRITTGLLYGRKAIVQEVETDDESGVAAYTVTLIDDHPTMPAYKAGSEVTLYPYEFKRL